MYFWHWSVDIWEKVLNPKFYYFLSVTFFSPKRQKRPKKAQSSLLGSSDLGPRTACAWRGGSERKTSILCTQGEFAQVHVHVMHAASTLNCILCTLGVH